MSSPRPIEKMVMLSPLIFCAVANARSCPSSQTFRLFLLSDLVVPSIDLKSVEEHGGLTLRPVAGSVKEKGQGCGPSEGSALWPRFIFPDAQLKVSWKVLAQPS